MTTTKTLTHATHHALAVGDRFRFDPQPGNRWWTLRARDDRWLIATCPAPFQPRGKLWYCVVDLYRDHRYNGVGPGMVRSSLNVVGGGWPYGHFDLAAFNQALLDLNRGTWGLSTRRLLIVHRFEVAV